MSGPKSFVRPLVLVRALVICVAGAFALVGCGASAADMPPVPAVIPSAPDTNFGSTAIPLAGESAVDRYTDAELQELVAPIALFPDELLAQVLASSAFP